MDLFSTVGAVTSLELTIILMAAVLLLDYWNVTHQQRLWRNVKAMLEEQDEPALEPVHQRAA
jgi:hypothetical protein